MAEMPTPVKVHEHRPPKAARTVYLVLDSRREVVSVAGSQRIAERIVARHASHGLDGYKIESWAVRDAFAE